MSVQITVMTVTGKKLGVRTQLEVILVTALLVTLATDSLATAVSVLLHNGNYSKSKCTIV